MLALTPRAAEASRASGLMPLSEAVPTMRGDELVEKYAEPSASFDRGTFEVLRLNTPRRFPGQGHLLRALYWFGGRRIRQAESPRVDTA
jgi:hypothetical protein